MHRWDFDLMATALHQRSVERASFLKELDKNMMEQSEQMEKALSAPAADETWKLSIQAIVETGKKFFAHTKELHNTEETRRANQERWALLRRRQVLRQQLGATAAKGIIHAQEPWTAFHCRIRELGRRLRAALRRSQAQAEENMLAELQEAAQQGAKAKVNRLCVQLARNGGRRFSHVAAASPSLEESKRWLESSAGEGGMSATILNDYDEEVRKVLSCFEAPSPGDLNKEATARKDLRDTLRIFIRGQKRNSCPGWSAPSELLIMALDPLYFAVRDSTYMDWISTTRTVGS